MTRSEQSWHSGPVPPAVRPDFSAPVQVVDLSRMADRGELYGEGLVIAEQIPAKLIPDVIKNTAVKIVHRLPARDDRDAVGATMNLLPAQSAYLVTLKLGEAAVFTDGMDHPCWPRCPTAPLASAAAPRPRRRSW
jgi:hypothetical protein